MVTPGIRPYARCQSLMPGVTAKIVNGNDLCPSLSPRLFHRRSFAAIRLAMVWKTGVVENMGDSLDHPFSNPL